MYDPNLDVNQPQIGNGGPGSPSPNDMSRFAYDNTGTPRANVVNDANWDQGIPRAHADPEALAKVTSTPFKDPTKIPGFDNLSQHKQVNIATKHIENRLSDIHKALGTNATAKIPKFMPNSESLDDIITRSKIMSGIDKYLKHVDPNTQTITIPSDGGFEIWSMKDSDMGPIGHIKYDTIINQINDPNTTNKLAKYIISHQ